MDESGGFSAEQFSRIYPDGVDASYWHLTRQRIIRRKLARHVPTGTAILDIGCGVGRVAEFLRESGFDAYGVDIAAAPVPERRLPYVFSPADAFALPEALRNRIGAVLLLDVLEHVRDPREMLAATTRALPALTTVIVTLPARSELWSHFDEYCQHYRRYDIAATHALLSSAGFVVNECGYFFHALYCPLRAVVRLKRRSLDSKVPRFPSAHRALAQVLDWEQRLVPSRWFGTSVLGVARLPSMRAPAFDAG